MQDKQDVLSMCALQLARAELATQQSHDVQSQAGKVLADVEAADAALLDG